METHDDLCPCINKGDKRWCECDLIAKVRADERERNREADGVAAYLAEENALTDLRAQVEALPADLYGYVYVGDVLALIDGAGGA